MVLSFVRGGAEGLLRPADPAAKPLHHGLRKAQPLGANGPRHRGEQSGTRHP
ncbi:hypothetical protein HMPREF0185_00443 [Brevundimonas diminuta 470-4]|nr:hypothetical protein HMPREF0185_00443 [Brevundimonas diminuta 470-4]